MIEDKPIPLSLYFTCNAPENFPCDGKCFQTNTLRKIDSKNAHICHHLYLKGSFNNPEKHKQINDTADISYNYKESLRMQTEV